MDKLHSNGDTQKISVNDSGENNSTENKFVSMVWDTVNRILDRFLSRHPKEKELRKFMSNECNLYGVDGKPTEEYKLRINEMEEYIKTHTVDDDIKSTLVHDEVEEELAHCRCFVDVAEPVCLDYLGDWKHGARIEPSRDIVVGCVIQ